MAGTAGSSNRPLSNPLSVEDNPPDGISSRNFNNASYPQTEQLVNPRIEGLVKTLQHVAKLKHNIEKDPKTEASHESGFAYDKKLKKHWQKGGSLRREHPQIDVIGGK